MKRKGIKIFFSTSEGKYITLLEIVLALSGSFSIYAQSLFIENITSYLSGTKTSSLFYASVLLVVSFLLPLSDVFLDFLKGKINNRMDIEWNTDVTELISRIPYENYEHTEIYNKLKQVTDNNLFVLEYGFFLTLLSTFISIFSYFIVLLRASITLVFAFLFISPLVGYFSSRLAQKEYRKSYDLNSDRRIIQYKSSVLRSRGYAKEIRVFEAGDPLLNEWKTEQKKLDTKILRIRMKHGLLSALISKSEYLVVAINLTILLFAYINNVIPLGLFIAISGQVFNIRILSKVQSFASSYKRLKEFRGTYSDVESIISEYDKNENQLCDMDSHKNNKTCISFKNVSFKYPNSEEFVLKNVNLHITNNEKIAIVGGNGAGKTTLIKIMLGLYFPTEGEVYINGRNSKYIDNEERSNIFSVVFQDFSKFCLTIDENLSLNDCGKAKNKEAFGLDKIEQHLSKGRDSIVGKDYGDGVDLSGGEWQRIAIARAFQKEKEVLIFDEPTASLDPVAEVELYKTIDEINENKDNIMIYITHRLGLTRNVDRIIVLENGVIVEDGKFDELMSLKGYYYRLFQSQKSLYDRRTLNE